MKEETQKAIAYALKLLSYRQRSRKELLEKLKRKEHAPAAAAEAVEYLEQLGYVDDQNMARSLKLSAADVRMLGRSGARQLMRSRGIPAHMADEALEDYDELEAGRALVQKKLRLVEGLPPETRRKKLEGYLGRRGFSYSTVRRLVLESENPEED